MRLYSDVKLGLQPSEGLTGAGISASKITHVAVSRKPYFLTIWASPHDMTAGFLYYEQFKREKDRSRRLFNMKHIFLPHNMEVTDYCCILLVTQTSPGMLWEEVTQGYE